MFVKVLRVPNRENSSEFNLLIESQVSKKIFLVRVPNMRITAIVGKAKHKTRQPFRCTYQK